MINYVNAIGALIPAFYIAYAIILEVEEKYKIKLSQSVILFCVLYAIGYIISYLLLCFFRYLMK